MNGMQGFEARAGHAERDEAIERRVRAECAIAYQDLAYGHEFFKNETHRLIAEQKVEIAQLQKQLAESENLRVGVEFGMDCADAEAVKLRVKNAEQAGEILRLQREVRDWKNHHETEVRRARTLKERTDMPIERVQAYEKWGNDLTKLAEQAALIEQLAKEAEWNRSIQQSVESLLTQAGYHIESSSRHQLLLMNFDALAAVEEWRKK